MLLLAVNLTGETTPRTVAGATHVTPHVINKYLIYQVIFAGSAASNDVTLDVINKYLISGHLCRERQTPNSEVAMQLRRHYVFVCLMHRRQSTMSDGQEQTCPIKCRASHHELLPMQPEARV